MKKKKEKSRKREKKKKEKKKKKRNTDTTKQRKAYMTLIWADDDEAGVVLAPASGSAVWRPGEGLCWFTVTITT